MDVRLLKRFRREAKKKVIVVRSTIIRGRFFIREDELGSFLYWDGYCWLSKSSHCIIQLYNTETIKDGYRKAINGYIRYLAEIERYKRERLRIMKLNKELRYNIS